MDKNVYQSEKYCWLHPDVVYGSVVIPVAIILFFNLVVFSLVMYSITCRRTVITLFYLHKACSSSLFNCDESYIAVYFLQARLLNY